jgi:Lar family restriction alleviation protein
MGSDDILTCPFCGGYEVCVCRTNGNACWIACDDCGAEAPSSPTRIGAIKNWNRRECDHDQRAVIVDDMDVEWKERRAARGAA